MRVIVPYTKLIGRVTNALDASGYEWEAVNVSESYQRYWYLVRELWAAGEDFTLIEHDVVVDPEVTLQGFESCPMDWCSCPYPYQMMPSGYYFGMGCTRYRAALLKRQPCPLVYDPEWKGWDKLHKPRHWCRIDSLMKESLYNSGEQIHPHDMVEHLGDGWPKHGCVKRPKSIY